MIGSFRELLVLAGPGVSDSSLIVVALDALIFCLYYTPSLTWLQYDGPLIIGETQGKGEGT